ncbi:MAG: glycoside hydrolase [Verrucomicrobiota bacterium]
MRYIRSLITFAIGIALGNTAHATTYTLDHPASPVSVTFNDSGARLTVTNKADGFVWKNPDASGGSTVTVNSVGPTSTTNLTANVTVSGQALTLAFELIATNGELRVTLGGTNATVSGGVVYPFPFFPLDGFGSAVVPVDSGYVVPTTNITFSPPQGQRGMEWFGGTDGDNVRGWVALVDTPDDYELKVRTGTIAGQTRLGTAPNWRGSNGNAARNPNLLSYERKLRYRFLNSGGYVALAKQFRQSALERGWLKTFIQKQAENPALDLNRFFGAPVCYLWGDGRSTNLLDALTNAGISKALIQVSINHSDQLKAFPATNLADAAWFDAVRARGFLGGFYDIYAAVRTNGQGGSAYDGFYYLWPPNAAADWTYRDVTNNPDAQLSISCQKAAEFAASMRIPAHLSRFDMDAYFYDVVCAVDLREDFATNQNHFATRSMDRTNRTALLNTAFTNATKRLLTGTEQGRSWAVPTLHWAEGKFWLGNGNSGISDGTWNDNSYPQIMTDVVAPTSPQLAALFADGYQAPLWDLVFHDCVATTVHWHRSHNKYLYLWDHQDRWAMLRGQPPLLNLTYAGVQGNASRQPNQITDTFNIAWSSRWTTMSNRFVQTFTNVCRWQEKVGWMEMIDHRRLAEDRSVQMTEFSADGGLSGRGIVMNFGVYDGAYGVTNSAWSGALRSQSISVAAGEWRSYAWPELRLFADGIAGNAVQLHLSGISAQPYIIETSTNLTNWTPWQTNSPTNAVLSLSDLLPPTASLRFYRAREL